MPSRAASRPPLPFRARVLAIVRRIPRGRVTTYGEVAALAGAPRAARAVGTVLRECRDGATPCHRVVGAGGVLGGWTGVLADKRLRLADEGITATLSRVQHFERVRWMPGAAGTDSRR
jgi:methylated-DNA-protein-cysteine methyltransferase-like protein